jgi:hypothetical protein
MFAATPFSTLSITTTWPDGVRSTQCAPGGMARGSSAGRAEGRVRSCVGEGFFGTNLSVAAGPMILVLLAGMLKGVRLGRKPACGLLGASLRRASETWGWEEG